jgi:2,4-dienoyl-CoA reductase (NADPH2)
MSLSHREAFPRLFSSIKVGGRTIGNRFVMSPLTLNIEEDWKKESKPYWEAMAEFYAARARANAELIVVGGNGTSVLGRWYPRGFSLSTYQAAEGMRQVTEAIHESGGTALLQLSHSGRAACSPVMLGASDVTSPYAFYKNWTPIGVPNPMLRFIKMEFYRAAALAHHAGFDGVEVNACNGTLLHNFLCRATNKRVDEYGGPIENRVRLLMEILGTVREAVPRGAEFTVACRLSVHDLHADGNPRADILYTHERVADSGLVDLITTSVGMPDSPVQTLSSHVPRGVFARCVKEVRDHLRSKSLTIPIAASHRITTPALAEQLLASDACDMVAVGRALLADSQFIKNAKENKHLASVPCIGCNHCVSSYWKTKRVTCAINPLSGFELEKALHPVKHPRAIAVIGAGPTGIVCALTLARRGHQVILYERNDEIGGQLNLAKLIPGKEEYWAILDHWTRELKESSVILKLNSKWCRADLAGGHQFLHAMVLCTGSQPRPITSQNLIGSENQKVVGFWDVLTRKVIPGNKVAILGSGAIGHDVASYLLHDPRVSRDQVLWLQDNGVNPQDMSLNEDRMLNPHKNGREVMIFQRANHPPDMTRASGWWQKQRLKAHGALTIRSATISKIDDDGLFVQAFDEDKRIFGNFIYDANTIVWCYGMLPNMVEATWIHEWIKDGAVERGQAAADFRIYMAGSCRDVMNMGGQGEQDLLKCIQEGYEIGVKV